ncbi:MAG: hypothetical protein IPL21_09155 [Saprospirales bacterium]|nr:hypothetical protein [Saprospirales bacterium]
MDSGVNYCWIHCASAGEFEQAIPIIYNLRCTMYDVRIAVSFFSSSGFEMYKDSDLADLFFYFPLDSKKNAEKLVEILKPSFAIFIRNEIWLNVLTSLNKKNISTFLVNANLQQKRNYFYQLFLNKTYPFFTKIFDTKTFGNTKLERVVENRNTVFNDAILEDFCKDSFVIILGSSWLEEERFIIDFYKKNKEKNPNLKIVIAPHENLSLNSFELKKSYGNWLSFYRNYTNGNILVLDKKGILKYAYRHADIAFIGGGFDKGVHNVSEAAVYGVPTIFGANYHKFEEINELVDLQLAFPVKNYIELEQKMLELMNNSDKRNTIKNELTTYFSSHEQVAKTIVTEIDKAIH